MATPVVSLSNVGVRFRLTRRNRKASGGHGRRAWTMWGLRHVSLDMGPGEIIGVIGANGAGKSTLIRTIAGVHAPDEGELVRRGRVAPLITPTGGLVAGLSGWDNVDLSGVLLGLSRAEARALRGAVAELSGLGEFMDAPARVYSAGMMTRLGFALAVASDPDVLVLDEVMTLGDEDFRERSEETLHQFIQRGRTILFASHEVASLAHTCDRVVWLDGGGVRETGDPAALVDRYLAEAHHVPSVASERVPITSLLRASRRTEEG